MIERKAVILVDFKNLLDVVIENTKDRLPDLRHLNTKEYLKISIKCSFAFLPLQEATDRNISELHNSGYISIFCPRDKSEKTKDKDKADEILRMFAEAIFDEHSAVTDVVIGSHDGDFTNLANFLKKRGKKVWCCGLENKIARNLHEATDYFLPLPLKEVELL